MLRSLRSRLTFTHTIVALFAVLVVALLTTALIQRGFETLADRQAQFEAANAQALLRSFYERKQSWSGVGAWLRKTFEAQASNQALRSRRLQLFDTDGTLLFDSAGRRPQQRQPLPDGIRRSIIVDGRSVGVMVLGESNNRFNQAEQEFLRRTRWAIAGGSLLALGAALLVGRLISRRVTQPLRSLKEAAQRLSSGARHEPLAPPPEAELSDLAHAFNIMAAELERQQSLRRQQIADIAHELRTPLSILQLQLESIEDGIEHPTPDLIRSLTEEVGLLARLVHDLQLLSLADADQLTLTISEIDAKQAIERAVQTAAPRARQQNIDLQIRTPCEQLLVLADPQRLTQILSNLIENGLRYTPPGGKVSVGTQLEYSGLAAAAPPAKQTTPNQTAMVIFEVSDSGPGIAPTEIPYIFDRFYRADRARARETGGSGLGLAIVHRLTELHNGRVWVTSTVGAGSTFHIALPAAAPES